MINGYDIMFESSRESTDKSIVLFNDILEKAKDNKITKVKSSIKDFVLHCNICSLYELDTKINFLEDKIILDNGNEIHYIIEDKNESKR